MNAHQRRVAKRRGEVFGFKMAGFIRMVSDTPPEIYKIGQIYENPQGQRFVAIGHDCQTAWWEKFKHPHDAIRKMRQFFCYRKIL